jgi:2'-5' RNA ligase
MAVRFGTITDLIKGFTRGYVRQQNGRYQRVSGYANQRNAAADTAGQQALAALFDEPDTPVAPPAAVEPQAAQDTQPTGEPLAEVGDGAQGSLGAQDEPLEGQAEGVGAELATAAGGGLPPGLTVSQHRGRWLVRGNVAGLEDSLAQLGGQPGAEGWWFSSDPTEGIELEHSRALPGMLTKSLALEALRDVAFRVTLCKGVDPAAVLTPRDFTTGELARAVRQAIIAEQEAIVLYEDQADAAEATDPKAAELLRDIADEERVHVGELTRLLHLLEADAAGLEAKGEAEAAKVLEKAASDRHDTCYIASYLPKDAKVKLDPLVRGGVNDDLHMTLLYIPEGIGEADREMIRSAVKSWAGITAPLRCRLEGVALFASPWAPLVSTVTVENGALAYGHLLEAIEAWGGKAFRRDYDFMPHVTLAYPDDAGNLPALPDPAKLNYSWTVDEVTLQFGDGPKQRVKLTGMRPKLLLSFGTRKK